MRIFAVVNTKGGTGKTTSSINLSAAFALRGKRVLLIDLDQQAHSTLSLSEKQFDLEDTIYAVLVEKTRALVDIILPLKPKGLYLAPGDEAIAGAEYFLGDPREPQTKNQLKQILEQVRESFDVVMIDCPPSRGTIMNNALIAATDVLIPVEAEFLSYDGIMRIYRTIEDAKEGANPDIDLAGFIVTKFLGQPNMSSKVVNALQSHFGDKVLTPFIPRRIRFSEAQEIGKPIQLVDPESDGAQAYNRIAEVLESNE